MPSANSSKEKLAFEEALEQLEALITSIEHGDVPLQELVSRFEEGTKLLNICQTHLAEAELKIERIRSDEQPTETVPLTLENPESES